MIAPRPNGEILSNGDAIHFICEGDVLADPTSYHVTPEVLREMGVLRRQGYNVNLVDVADPYRPGPELQRKVDCTIAQLEAMQLQANRSGGLSGAAVLRDAAYLPAVSIWTDQLTQAMALQPTYRPDSETLGGGVSANALDVPIFSAANASGMHEDEVMSARQIVKEESPAGGTAGPSRKWQRFISFETYIGTPIDPESRILFSGSLDAAAIRSRAAVYRGIVGGYIAELEQDFDDVVTMASLGCGAAEPLFELIEDLKARGVEKPLHATLVDRDVAALACANALAHSHGVDANIQIQRRDLMQPLDEHIPPVDIVDLLGVFEYFPADSAVELLERAAKLVKPGGLIVFGNMLDHRQQQVFFSNVIRWPLLQQRSIHEMFGIISAAGFSPSDVGVHIPANDGVYAVYALRVPHATNDGVSTATTETSIAA